MATTSYGTPYVQSSDLVSGWPTASLNVADRIDAVSYAGNGLNAQTGTSYTLAVTDAGKLVTFNNAAAVAVTLPQDSTANLPVGSVTRIYNLGAGLVTVSAGSGATLQGGSVTVAQYDACNITKLSANTYGIAAKAGMTLLGTVSLAGASAVLNSIPATYRDLRIVITDYVAGTGSTFLLVKPNGGPNVTYQAGLGSNNATVNTYTANSGIQAQVKGAGASTSSSKAMSIVNIFEYANAAQHKAFTTVGIYTDSGSTQIGDGSWGGFHFNTEAAVSSLTFASTSGNMTSGTAYVYGVK